MWYLQKPSEEINVVHGSSEYDFRTQTCVFYQVKDDFLYVGSQRIVVKRTAGHLFRYCELPRAVLQSFPFFHELNGQTRTFGNYSMFSRSRAVYILRLRRFAVISLLS